MNEHIFKKRSYLYNLLKKTKGQSLLEAIVTLAIALAIVTSIVSLVNKTNARSTNARQATQASKLAQEGLEIIRNIRDVDGTAVKFGLCGSSCRWGQLYGYNIVPDPKLAYLDRSCIATEGSWCLRENTAPATETLILGIFNRSVKISDDPGPTGDICSDAGGGLGWNQTKRVTVVVEWDSPYGHQQRMASTCITNWRN